MNEKYIAIDDAAVEIGIDRTTLWRWIRRDGVKTYRVPGSRKTHILREDAKSLGSPQETRKRPQE